MMYDTFMALITKRDGNVHSIHVAYKMLLGHAITGLDNEFEVRNICTSVVPLKYFHHRDRLKRLYILT